MTEEEKPDKGTDYTKAQKKQKAPEGAEPLEKVVAGPVLVKKPSLGTKIKDIFVAADFKSVVGYVGYEIMIPAIKGMIVDGFQRGAERAVYGESRRHRPPFTGPGVMSRITYNAPVSREREGYRDPRTAPPSGGSSYPRSGRPDFVLQSKEEAELVLDAMYNVFEVYEQVSLAQLNELVGLPVSHTDYRWGWTDLRGSGIRPDRAGFWLDLPKPVEIAN